MNLQWEVPHDENESDPHVRIAFAIQGELKRLVYEQLSYIADLFPFYDDRYDFSGYKGEKWIAVRLRSNKGYQFPHGVIFKNEEAEFLHRIVTPFIPRSYIDWLRMLGSEWYNVDTFTYIGPINNYFVSWQDIVTQLMAWLKDIVIPEIEARNRRRVLAAIPTPPQYNIEKVLNNIYVLESEVEQIQGTCFHLKEIGLVTCEHVIAPNLKIFSHKNPSQSHRIKVKKSNRHIDIALITAEKLILGDGLEIGDSDLLNRMDHIAIAGFPNYRYGDSGILSPGLVIGFRPVSGISRILVNTPIIAGNSGGPVLNAFGEVIGIAVTGADRMENAESTENHGVVPINSLKYL